MSKSIKVGDKVTIVGKSRTFNGEKVSMKPYLGKVYTIASVVRSDVTFVEKGVVKPSIHAVQHWSWKLDDVEPILIPEGYEIAPSSDSITPKQLKDKTYIVTKGEVYRKITAVKMTLAEIEKALGKKIQLVDASIMKPTLEVGSEVTIKSFAEIIAIESGVQPSGWTGFVEDMKKHCGKTYKIKECFGNFTLEGASDMKCWAWCKEMFVGF